MNIEEFIQKYKPYSFHFDYNQHKDYYDTVKEYLETNEDMDIVDKEECIKNDTVYNIHVYPRTPIGFYSVYASTMQKAMEWIIQAFEENEV